MQASLRNRLVDTPAPLYIAAYVTWAAVSAATLDWRALFAGDARELAGALALLAVLVIIVWCQARGAHDRTRYWPIVGEGVLIVLADWLLRGGQTGVLLVIVAAQFIGTAPLRATLGWLAAFNLLLLWNWTAHIGDLPGRLLTLVPLLGFQGFAAMTSHYARTAEKAAERLAQVNAELLATQHLLEESARSGERLKVSRELHDVTGHKLTALKLTLTHLQRSGQGEKDADIHLCAQLADELLTDIRGVVSTLREHDGMSIDSALHALARPLPHTRIEVQVEPGLSVDSVAHGEALLRCAQEAITNAMRHGQARHIRVHCRRDADRLVMLVDSDGAAPGQIVFGNGLTGMQERLNALGGTLQVETTSSGVQVTAMLPSLAG